MKTPESGVLRACMDLLAAERIWFERRNTRTMWEGKRPIFFGMPGTADIMATPVINVGECGDGYLAPTVLWIECKSDTGKQSDDQKAFQAQVEAAGHSYLLAHSSDDLLAWLKEYR
jgi:hypothetical protein